MDLLIDDNIKKTGKLYFVLKVFALPILVEVLLAVGVFYLKQNKLITEYDEFYSYLILLLCTVFFIGYLQKLFVKMSNGTIYKYTQLKYSNGFLKASNATYDVVYKNSKANNIVAVLLSSTLLLVAIWLFVFVKISVVMPVFIGLIAIVVLLYNILALFANAEILKLSSSGFCTEQYGFIDWKDVENLQIVTNRNLFNKKTLLQVQLKNSMLKLANMPDINLGLNQVKGHSYIETIALNLMRNRKGNLCSNIL
jgi:hypothetical protein